MNMIQTKQRWEWLGLMLAVALGLTACEPTDTAQGSSDAPAPSSADARFEDNSEEPDLDPDAYQTARRPYTAWGGEVELYFTRPGTQRGEEEDPEADDAIADAIRNAQTSVDLCLYEFNRQNIVDAVVEAHQRGVQIRFAGDGDELHDEGYIELENNGVVLKYRKPHDRIMHNKFVVIDGEVVFTGSMNMSENGVNLNNNHVLKITDSDVAALYKAEFEQARQELDLSTTGELIWRVFDNWEMHGASKATDWAMMAIGILGTGNEGLKLSVYLKRWPGENAYRRAQKGLAVYRMIGSDLALMTLNGIAAKVKYKSVKSAANDLIQAIARNRGLTPEELADRIIPDCGLDEEGKREFDYGDRKFSLVLDDNLQPVVRDLSKDKILKNLPKPGKKDDEELGDAARADFRDMKKQIKEVVKTQTPRLENAMVAGRRWEVEDFQTLLVGHPLMCHFAQRLLWAIYEGKKKEKIVGYLRVDEEGALLDASDEPITLKKNQRLGIPHPLELDDDANETWGTVFGDYEIIPPFPQLNRPVFTLEKGDSKGDAITKFENITLSAGAIRGHIDRDGWTKGNPEDAGIIYTFHKYFATADITATAGMSYGIYAGGASWDEDQSINSITFHKGKRAYGNTIKLANVPEQLISEVLYSMGKLTSTV